MDCAADRTSSLAIPERSEHPTTSQNFKFQGSSRQVVGTGGA